MQFACTGLSLPAGATVTSIGKAAAEDLPWAELQCNANLLSGQRGSSTRNIRSAVWWVGEHANAAAMEYAGDNEAVKATAGITAAIQKTASPGEIIAMQVCAALRCAVLRCTVLCCAVL